MITCERHRALIPESTCIARQRIIQRSGTWNTHQRTTALEVQYACKGCEIGEKLLRGEGVMEHQKTKACRVCGQEKEALKDFHKSKNSKDGREGICKTCKVALARERRQAKAKPKKAARNMSSVAEMITGSQGSLDQPDTIKKNNHPVDLDDMVRRVFAQAGHPGLFDALEKQARKEFRTPALQVVAIIAGSV